MKILLASSLLFSAFLFSQEQPLQHFKKRGSDTIAFNTVKEEITKSRINKPTDSSLYKILNKKIENPDVYTMLIKKPDTDKLIKIPNLQPEDRRYENVGSSPAGPPKK